ncbi:MAG: hypothetical protein II597_06915, partial [Prevotella sp.]|nr:hypothetical protein [Prevotella sp.]
MEGGLEKPSSYFFKDFKDLKDFRDLKDFKDLNPKNQTIMKKRQLLTLTLLFLSTWIIAQDNKIT